MASRAGDLHMQRNIQSIARVLDIELKRALQALIVPTRYSEFDFAMWRTTP